MLSGHFTICLLFLFLFCIGRAQALDPYYAPTPVICPSDDSLIRDTGTPRDRNQTLHKDEIAYVEARKRPVLEGLQDWLSNLPEQVYLGVVAEDIPSIALSLSGGNFRAALFSAAALEAFDSRDNSSVKNGLGGLLQSSTYMSSLSGGSYVATSLVFNDFAPGRDLVFGDNATSNPGWQLDQALLTPGSQGQDTTAFIGDLMNDLGAKRLGANFTVTFCDMWGRALAYHFLPGTPPGSFASNATSGNHAASVTFSSMTNLTVWKNHRVPFPLVVINVNSPNAHGTVFGGNGTLPLQSVNYELNPFEFGSYEPQLASFVSLPYLGSTFSNGTPIHCVNDFDNTGLMIGTSSCDFNPLNVTNSSEWTSPDGLGGLVGLINETFGTLQPGAEYDATLVPNPFVGMHHVDYQDTAEANLALMDGSLDDQNDPLFPLLVKARKVDMIVVLDSSGETSDFKPTGQSLLATREKVSVLPQGFMNFPTPFPQTQREFLDLKLNMRPVFFGCDGPNSTDATFPCVSPPSPFAPNHALT
ncbi:lysophospholipase [Epithele typhae]|uniref:lysophospholipase n=1 Tax=Epithele typhae TaxID=378194 RepID=UPI0020076263|nr:lysophospholipase [Epithele typhae]KAH9917657.1 lysophospholipase [Epithele typhae]